MYRMTSEDAGQRYLSTEDPLAAALRAEIQRLTIPASPLIPGASYRSHRFGATEHDLARVAREFLNSPRANVPTATCGAVNPDKSDVYCTMHTGHRLLWSGMVSWDHADPEAGHWWGRVHLGGEKNG